MSQRQWQSAGGAAVLANQPAGSVPRTQREPPRPAVWADAFPAADPARQVELLAAARAAGVVDARALVVADGDRARRLLDAARLGHLPAPAVPAVVESDKHLDADQSEAVARALATPDVCLVLGGHGTGRARVAETVARRLCERGESVLIVSPYPSRCDAVAERLAGAGLGVTRATADGETSASVSAAAWPCTPAGREQAFCADAPNRARAAITGLDARLARLHTADQDLLRLRGLVTVSATTREELSALGADAAATPERTRAAVEAGTPSDGLAAELARLDAEFAEALAKLQAARAEAKREHDGHSGTAERLTAELGGLEPLAAAKRGGRWWSAQWWKATLQGGVVAGADACRAALDKAKAAVAESVALVARLETDADALRRQHADSRAAGVQAEIDLQLARQADTRQALESRLADTNAEAARLTAALPTEVRPAAADVRAVDAAATACRLAAEQLRSEIDTRRAALETLERYGADMARHLTTTAPVAVAPLAALAHGSELPRASFDFLIFLDADTAGEADVLRAGRRARRWLLLSAEPDPRGVFAELWSKWRGEVWTRDDEGRLCCRLRDVPEGERHRLEAESLADSPDIEVRFFAPDDGEPAVAEVVFPAGTTLVDAKAFVFRELNEFAASVPAAGTWDEDDAAVTWRGFPPRPGAEVRTLDLGEGVAEEFDDAGDGPSLTRTLSVRFDRAAGWDRDGAGDWLGTALGGRADTGRACRLTRPHRRPAAEFVAVPADGRPRKPGGAGFEVELSDPKQRDRLPPDLRAALPDAGLVNLPEAQEVVRVLRHLPGAKNVAALALEPAQARLIDVLLNRPGVFVGTPDRAAGREFGTVVVSLTRSHSHRAVAYGPHPGWAALAVTRAGGRLVVVGDAGTLARRAAWDRTIGREGAVLAAREREWAARLSELAARRTPANGPGR